MEGVVRDLVDGSVAPSTKRVYASGQRRFLEFCRDTDSNPFPLSENQLCKFVAHLSEEGLKHTSIKGYLSAVRRMQIVGGMGDPFTASWPLLECTLRGVKLRQAKKEATRSRTRLPITPSLMKKLRSTWESCPRQYHAVGCLLYVLLWFLAVRRDYGAFPQGV